MLQVDIVYLKDFVLIHYNKDLTRLTICFTFLLFLHSSLDGFVEGLNGAMDIVFFAYDHDLESYANLTLATADTIL